MSAILDPNDDQGMFDSNDSPLVVTTGEPLSPEPPTANVLLHRMRQRVLYYGSPIPEGYVPPPGIDLAALLKQVPWPPPSADENPPQGKQQPRE